MSEIVFLVGAGRSGTTLLYKLLALHSEIAVITNYDQKFGLFSPAGWFTSVIRQRTKLKKELWFSEGGNAYFRPGLKRFLPYPVEGEPIYARCGVPLVLDEERPLGEEVGRCLKKGFQRLRAAHGGQILLTKRTANNRRLAWIREVFPNARFVNLMRDGREVAYSLSTVHWWDDHTVFWAGKTARQMEVDGWDRLDVCANNWVREVEALEAGLDGLSPEQRFDVRYESILQDPIPLLRQIVEFMGLEANAEFVAAIESLDLKERSAKWRKVWSDDQIQQVSAIEQDLLAKHGYF